MKSDQCLVLMKQRWSTSRSYHPSWMSHSDCSYNTIHYTDGDEMELDVVRKSTRWGHTREINFLDILRGPVLSKTSCPQKVPLFSTLFKAGWLLLQVLRFLLLVRPHLLKRLMAGFTIVRHCTILHCIRFSIAQWNPHLNKLLQRNEPICQMTDWHIGSFWRRNK